MDSFLILTVVMKMDFGLRSQETPPELQDKPRTNAHWGKEYLTIEY